MRTSSKREMNVKFNLRRGLLRPNSDRFATSVPDLTSACQSYAGRIYTRLYLTALSPSQVPAKPASLIQRSSNLWDDKA